MMFDGFRMKIILHEETALGYICIYKKGLYDGCVPIHH